MVSQPEGGECLRVRVRSVRRLMRICVRIPHTAREQCRGLVQNPCSWADTTSELHGTVRVVGRAGAGTTQETCRHDQGRKGSEDSCSDQDQTEPLSQSFAENQGTHPPVTSCLVHASFLTSGPCSSRRDTLVFVFVSYSSEISKGGSGHSRTQLNTKHQWNQIALFGHHTGGPKIDSDWVWTSSKKRRVSTELIRSG